MDNIKLPWYIEGSPFPRDLTPLRPCHVKHKQRIIIILNYKSPFGQINYINSHINKRTAFTTTDDGLIYQFNQQTRLWYSTRKLFLTSTFHIFRI